MFPYGWLVYGVPTEKGVRLTASRRARARLEHVWSGRFAEPPSATFSAELHNEVRIIEAANWREALEELYRAWAPRPGGNVLD